LLTKKRILVAPLDWGLGHATRCIPIIRELQQQGAEVLLASDGRAYQLLRQEFPELPLFRLPPYNIHYPYRSMVASMAVQLPKILRTMLLERRMTEQLVQRHRIDAVLSDNRYGCCSRPVPSVFMTHQLHIRIGLPLLEWLVRQGNHGWINMFFDECWIPDVADTPNLAGDLAHGQQLPRTHYIGVLSRMQKLEVPLRYDVVAVLSGPEPQRSLLEEKILEQAQQSDLQMLIVGGRPEEQRHEWLSPKVEYLSFLPSQALNKAMAAAKVIISRSGYSTVMDLAKLGKRAVLIPTPGQTEQEYLAQHFFEQGIFYTQAQNAFDLKKAVQAAGRSTGFQNIDFENHLLRERVAAFLAKC